MNRAILLGTLAMLVGCGNDDDRPAALTRTPSNSGGRTSTGGKTGNTAGRAGSANHAGTAGRTGIQNVSGNAGRGGTSGGMGPIASIAGMAGSGATAGDSSPTYAPTVKITSPLAVKDPNTNGIIVASTGNDAINVKCSIQPASSSSTIDATSVKIELIQDGKRTSAKPTGGVPEFQATFSPTDFVTGQVTFECSASAKNNDASTAVDAVQTFVDRGPVVTISSPENKSSHASSKPLRIAAAIAPQPVDPTDTRSDTTTVEVKVDDRTVRPPTPPDASGLVQIDTLLNDPAVFKNTLPVGNVAVQVIATNKRGTIVTETITIFVDQAPPSIEVSSPTPKQVVKETGSVRFSVSDADSDINLATLRARFGSADATTGTVFYYRETDTRWSCSPSASGSHHVYNCIFRYIKADVKDFISEATLFIDASDVAGNDTQIPSKPSPGNATLNIDRAPPIVHLNPPNIRYVRKAADKYVCSNSFDPVGPGSVGDLEAIGIAPFFRAFVWDTAQSPTNGGIGNSALIRCAHADPASVSVYLQRNTSVPLLIHQFVDNNGDGKDDNNYCNALNTDPPAPAATPSVPNPSQPRPDSIRLEAVTPWGSPLETGDLASTPPTLTSNCELGKSTSIPQAQCQSPADLPLVISHSASRSIAAIYAKSPTNGQENRCTGTDYQLPTTAPFGWMCAAAVASDQAGAVDGSTGNMGVSPPIRLCYQSDPSTSVACAAPPPTCTDGCKPYDAFVDEPPIPYVYKLVPQITAPTN